MGSARSTLPLPGTWDQTSPGQNSSRKGFKAVVPPLVIPLSRSTLLSSPPPAQAHPPVCRQLFFIFADPPARFTARPTPIHAGAVHQPARSTVRPPFRMSAHHSTRRSVVYPPANSLCPFAHHTSHPPASYSLLPAHSPTHPPLRLPARMQIYPLLLVFTNLPTENVDGRTDGTVERTNDVVKVTSF